MSGSMRATATKAATVDEGSPDLTSTGSGAALAPESRECPTREEGHQPLFQHRVTVNQCQSKQRGLYHKCFTCIHANGRD